MSVARVTRARVAALCLGALAASALAVAGPGTARADNYPGQDEIDAAKAAVESQKSTVADLDAAVVQLEQARADAEANELLLADRYSQAVGELDDAKAALASAQEKAAAALAALKKAQDDLAAVAMASYREGGSFGQLGAVMSADGFDSVVVQSDAIARASDETNVKVQRVEAAQIVADAMQRVADEAATRAADAEAAAKTAYEDAQAASVAAQQAFADADAARTAAVDRLAELRGVTVALENERQAGLAAEREAKRRAAAEKAIKEAEEAAKAAANSGGSSSGGSTSGGSTSGGSTSGGSTSGGSSSGGSTSGGSTSGGDTSGGGTSGGDTSGGSEPTPPPATGSWRSSAADGEAAVAKGLTLVGYPYVLGGSSLSGFDCSWLTMTSWQAAGYGIPRSSQSQYNALTKVPLSQMRPGDLVFYGTNRNASQIYHVALYIGNGKVVEAARPGVNSLIRGYDESWRIDNLIPYVGRP